MSNINEPLYTGEFLHKEGDTSYTRGIGEVLKANNVVLQSGTILGRETRGAQTLSAVAVAGDTTNDTIGTLTAAVNAPAGKFVIVGVATATNAGVFHVFRPDGTFDGVGKVGVAYDSTAKGGVGFTIADGSTDMAVGDRFEMTVAYAAGSQKLVPLDYASAVGADKFAAILIDGVRVSATDTRNPQVLKRGDAIVIRDEVVFPVGATDQQKAATFAEMEAVRILNRVAV